MEKRRAEKVIKKPADEVWARIRDFGDISWIPNAGSCIVEGEDRKVSKPGWGFVLTQRLVNHDDEKHTYSYILPAPLNFESLLGPDHIVRVLEGTISVTPKGGLESTVTWDIETEDFLIEGTHREYQAALESLKAQLRG
jgi:hypothetical protein